MKITPIVASLALLATGTASAAYHGMSNDTQTQLAAGNAKLAKLQAVINRNSNPYYAEEDWFKRITISGLLQVGTMYSSRVAGPAFLRFGAAGVGRRSGSDIWLSRANFYVDADVNSWTTVHGAISAPQTLFPGFAAAAIASDDEAAYRKAGILDEAYVTIGNFAKTPVYFRAGWEYVRFGDYRRNRTPADLVQLLTQTQASTLELGFVDTSGFNGAVYVFRGNPRVASPRRYINNGGAQIGYDYDNGTWGVSGTIDYMYNMGGAVNALVTGALAAGYTRTTGGLHVGLKGHYNQIDGRAQFVTALRRFTPALTPIVPASTRGALPKAYLLELGYSHSLMGHDARVAANWQQSFETTAFTGFAAPAAAGGIGGVPQYRVQGDYDVNVWKNTDVQVTGYWDKDWGVGRGGSNRSKFTILGTLSVKFA